MYSFRLENVKSFIDTEDIEIKPINIFVGRNSSGKSSLIRFPVVLSQTFSNDVFTPFLFFGKLIDYGNFEDVVHNKTGDEMVFSFNFEGREVLKNALYYAFRYHDEKDLKNIVKDSKKITVKVTITKISKRILVKEFNLILDNHLLLTVLRDEKNKYFIRLYKKIHDKKLLDLDTPQDFHSNIVFKRFIPELDVLRKWDIKDMIHKLAPNLEIGLESELVTILSDSIRFGDYETLKEKVINEFEVPSEKLRVFDKANDFYTTLKLVSFSLTGIHGSLNRFSNTLSYIGPFRKDPERIYRESESSFLDVGKNGENASMILRQADRSKTNLLNNVSKWFAESTGYNIKIEEIENSNLFKIVVAEENKSVSHNIIDAGYGFAQVLPIVTQIYYENNVDDEIKRNLSRFGNKKIFVIEQPELHLHPAAQSSLADLFVEKIQKSKDAKFFIETHSEHLIRKLQVLIADPNNKITPDDVAIYYIDKKEGGSSFIRRMEISPSGQFLEKWPSGFFDKSFELSRDLLKFASLRGKQ
ncbi:DUF3696 domain-containing protein [Bacillus mycoides]|uniref:DUF3696 domain-containing protein n=1 Tax=Bacillus mycoides TaxID=1405 RepID=UPI003D25DEE9